MKAFLSKALFVLAIVGLIAAGNLLFPNPENDRSSKVSTAEAPAEEPAPE